MKLLCGFLIVVSTFFPSALSTPLKSPETNLNSTILDLTNSTARAPLRITYHCETSGGSPRSSDATNAAIDLYNRKNALCKLKPGSRCMRLARYGHAELGMCGKCQRGAVCQD
jgi:hypothetical protein